MERLAKYGIKPFWPLGSIAYKYTSYETALKIIENGTLKFSAPSEFNDPFELTNSLIDTSFRKKDLREWLNTFSHLSNNSKKQLFKDNHNEPEAIIKAFNQSLDKIKSETGICCFSKSPKKTLMWSHYANNHSGVCLGFNILPIGMEEFSMLCVNYLDKIVPVNYFREKDTVLFYWLYSKSKVWEYEEEVRAVYTNKNGYIDFERNVLEEIYFGLRMPQDHINKLNQSLNDLNYQVRKKFSMQIDQSTFDLKERRL